MKQITEDYVSYEVAKLLKEKGFDNEEVSENGGFYCDYKCDGTDIGIVYESQMLNKDLARNEYLRPTHQMALKWLRGVHSIYITSEPDINDKHCFYPVIYTMTEESWDMQCFEELEELSFDKPEQAVEAAFNYVLKNLI